METTIYVFYDSKEGTGRCIRSFKNLSEAKKFSEQLYKQKYFNINICPVNKAIKICKMMYKVIYTLQNKKIRMITFIGYSDELNISYCHIDDTMKELGVKEYKVIPTYYDDFIKTFKKIKKYHNTEGSVAPNG